MCKKQTSGSHSSTEAELVSLDAGLRMDGIPARDLWNLVIENFHSPLNQPNKSKDSKVSQENLSQVKPPNLRNQMPTKHTNLGLTNVVHVSSNGKSSGSSAVLYVFEDKDAVIKMIIKGRSPTMRHVSRTHRVAWIGCFTGSIWTQKFKFDTSTPNI